MAGIRYKAIVASWNPNGAIWLPLEQTFDLSMDAIVLDAKTNLDSRLPHTSRNPTGELRRSVRKERKSRFYALLTARKKYAMSQEAGSRPHEIVARRKSNLVFPWEGSVSTVGGGSWDSSRLFIGPRVNHPGTEATNFASDAAAGFLGVFLSIGRALFR